jgi:uncharacterized protein
MIEPLLDEKEARVIGSLIEKELSTPEYYPLSLNALTNACNQKSNREPVVAYDEETVEDVLEELIRKKLVNKSMVGRVPKYEELFIRDRNLVPREAAIVCVLLLRGPQTAAEIRSRCFRLYDFESAEAVMETIKNLQTWGMVQRLPRQPGQKEPRYRHLFTPQAEPPEHTGLEGDGGRLQDERLELIERELAELKEQMAELKGQVENFRKQFE